MFGLVFGIGTIELDLDICAPVNIESAILRQYYWNLLVEVNAIR